MRVFTLVLQSIHQFDIRGLFFAMGSGHELGVKEPIPVISDNVKIITLEKNLKLSSNIVDFTSLYMYHSSILHFRIIVVNKQLARFFHP